MHAALLTSRSNSSNHPPPVSSTHFLPPAATAAHPKQDAVSVLGRPPFHDTALTTCGDLSYVGGNWTRDIAFAGTSIPLTVRARAVR